MSDQFNPYREWLDLDEELLRSESVPNHYQLLGLPLLESDYQRIVRAADKAQAKVRSHRPGPHAVQWAKLLDQLKEVRATLTDPGRKAQYDAQFQQSSAAAASHSHGIRGAAMPSAPAAAPMVVAAPAIEEAQEASSLSSSAASTPQHAWPPGMRPPGSVSPAPAPQPEEPKQAPLDLPLTPEPAAWKSVPSPGVASDAIPLSALWPAPQAGSAAPASPTPYVPAQPTAAAAVPLAVPIAALQPLQPNAPAAFAYPGQSAAQVPMAHALPGGHGSSVPGYGYPAAESALQPHHGNASADPMAPVPSGWRSPAAPSIPMGTAVPSGAPVGMAVGPHEAGGYGTAASWNEAGHTSGAEGATASRSETTPRRPAKSSNKTTMLLAVGAVAVLVVGAVVLFGGFGGSGKTPEVAQNVPSPNEPDLDEIELRPLGTADLPSRQTPPPAEPIRPTSPVPAEPAPEIAGPNDPDMEMPVRPAPATPEPMPAEPEPEPMPPNTPAAVVAMKPETVPEPVPVPAEPMATPPTAQEIAQLSKLLTTTRHALTDQNVDEAKQTIDQALKLAKAPAHVAKAQRLQMLVTLVSEFWRAVDESIAGVEAGAVITIGSTEVAIVEITPDLLIIRVAGINKRYPRTDMPEGLAMGLANNWLDKDSEVTPLVRGAFYAIARDAKPDDAAEQWRQAAAKGADVGDLPLTLIDKYDEATLTAEAASMRAAATPTPPRTAAGSLSEADKQALGTALQTARAAMSSGQLADADAQLTIASNIAAGSELEPVVKRTQTLLTHVRGFWDAVARGMSGLGEGSKVTVGSTEIAVMAASRDELTYTVAGTQFTKRINELPGGLAMSIARTVIKDDEPASGLQRGAFYAVAANASPDDARAAWNEAAGMGADVSELMLTLDDTYQW